MSRLALAFILFLGLNRVYAEQVQLERIPGIGVSLEVRNEGIWRLPRNDSRLAEHIVDGKPIYMDRYGTRQLVHAYTRQFAAIRADQFIYFVSLLGPNGPIFFDTPKWTEKTQLKKIILESSHTEFASEYIFVVGDNRSSVVYRVVSSDNIMKFELPHIPFSEFNSTNVRVTSVLRNSDTKALTGLAIKVGTFGESFIFPLTDRHNELQRIDNSQLPVRHAKKSSTRAFNHLQIASSTPNENINPPSVFEINGFEITLGERNLSTGLQRVAEFRVTDETPQRLVAAAKILIDMHPEIDLIVFPSKVRTLSQQLRDYDLKLMFGRVVVNPCQLQVLASVN